mmetsp:Transcript_10542/g.43013  ORF Transcript_10542/g.43013 Transcript_10542/m.43013 type:complete len:673 (+) Transcript_10542:185-2203(+)
MDSSNAIQAEATDAPAENTTAAQQQDTADESTQNNYADHTGQEEDAEQDERAEPKGPPQACLFVASLANETTEEAIRAFFGLYGQVLKIKLLKDRSARPYAFVQFQDMESAEAALQQTNGKSLDNRRLRVERAKVNRTLFLAKLSRALVGQQLREVVEEYGPVESVTIIKNHQTNKSKGCGFVKFVYREDAMDAFVGLKNKQRKWVVEWATSTNDPDLLGVDKYNIFIGGLNPQLITQELLKERFIRYGDIESITLINRGADPALQQQQMMFQQQQQQQMQMAQQQAQGQEGQEEGQGQGESQGQGQTEAEESAPMAPRSAFAFVRYKSAAHSAAAIENENGVEWLERRIRVQYCESQEMKNKRRANKYMQSINQFNSQFYRGMPVAPVGGPMLMMGGMPAMYNMGPMAGAPGMQKYNPYLPRPIPKGMEAEVMAQGGMQYMHHPQGANAGPFPTYPMFYNGQAPPWMFAPQHGPGAVPPGPMPPPGSPAAAAAAAAAAAISSSAAAAVLPGPADTRAESAEVSAAASAAAPPLSLFGAPAAAGHFGCLLRDGDAVMAEPRQESAAGLKSLSAPTSVWGALVTPEPEAPHSFFSALVEGTHPFNSAPAAKTTRSPSLGTASIWGWDPAAAPSSGWPGDRPTTEEEPQKEEPSAPAAESTPYIDWNARRYKPG